MYSQAMTKRGPDDGLSRRILKNAKSHAAVIVATEKVKAGSYGRLVLLQV
jgi:hypothetical protein